MENTFEQNKEIGMTILQQLQPQGKPGIIMAMCGTKQFVIVENGVQFRYRGCPKHNTVVIKLNGLDLYDVEFWKVSGADTRKVSEHNNIYDDMLTGIFEKETGLYLSL